MTRISYILLPLSLISLTFSASAQPINWDSVRADYTDKYHPQQIPAWLFPVIFEEGGGQRDTIYLGYDSDARDLGWPRSDTIFGERFWPVDTGRFNVIWSGLVNDTAFESIVVKTLTDHLTIVFFDGYYPLTVYWDSRAFYSDSLPFPDTVSPRGIGLFDCRDAYPNYHICSTVFPYLMADDPRDYYYWDSCVFTPPTSLPYVGPFPCNAEDSIVLYGASSLGGGTSIEIVPYGSVISGIPPTSRPADHQLLKVYPNPGTGYAILDWKGKRTAFLRVFNLQGINVLERVLNPGKRKLDLTHLPAGIYLIQVISAKGNIQTTTYFLIQ